MKNHEWVDGKLLQSNKKYSHLKLKQKEKINQWMYDSYRKVYKEKGAYPDDKEDERILFCVMEQIEKAEIRISYREVCKQYRSVRENLRKRLVRENQTRDVVKLTIETIDTAFSVCKVENYSEVNIEEPFCFIGSTDEEKSLVCPTQKVPAHCLEREDGWRGFRIAGVLDFSLIGIMARITKVLANNEIGVFVVSTFNTDYIFVKDHHYQDAVGVLKSAGYQMDKSARQMQQGEVWKKGCSHNRKGSGVCRI